MGLTVPAHHLRVVLDTAAERGASAAALCESLALDARLLDDLEARVPLETATKLYDECAGITGDPAFGLHVAERSDYFAFDALGFAISTKPNLREAFESLAAAIMDAAAQLAALIADGVMVCPGRRAARDHVAAGNRVFAYQFSHVTSLGQTLNWGAFHGSDIPFVWGNVPAGITATPDELSLMARVQELWTSFAKTGTPQASDAPVWAPYDAQMEPGLDLDVTISAENGWQHAADCDVWERVLGSDL